MKRTAPLTAIMTKPAPKLKALSSVIPAAMNPVMIPMVTMSPIAIVAST
jgi:hypothetical protein